MFYLTAVGGSSQCPSGERGVVYIRRPGDFDWAVIDQVMCKVSGYRICSSEDMLVLNEVCDSLSVLFIVHEYRPTISRESHGLRVFLTLSRFDQGISRF